MDYECVIFVLKRCNNLLERKNGTAAVKNEYRCWLSYLEKQLRFYKKLVLLVFYYEFSQESLKAKSQKIQMSTVLDNIMTAVLAKG